MVKKRKDDELLRGGRSDITHVFIFPSFLPLSLSFALNAKLFVFLRARCCCCCCVSLLSEEFEREREGIYFFPFFSKEKAQKDYMEKHTFKMRSLFFFPSPTFPRGGDENREMERKNDETREWRW
tara:strand:+ start:3160 stop:3534 length:375 start_codon:yes stop_codon:yes gene_type:complete